MTVLRTSSKDPPTLRVPENFLIMAARVYKTRQPRQLNCAETDFSRVGTFFPLTKGSVLKVRPISWTRSIPCPRVSPDCNKALTKKKPADYCACEDEPRGVDAPAEEDECAD